MGRILFIFKPANVNHLTTALSLTNPIYNSFNNLAFHRFIFYFILIYINHQYKNGDFRRITNSHLREIKRDFGLELKASRMSEGRKLCSLFLEEEIEET